jgi:hypothetical protein
VATTVCLAVKTLHYPQGGGHRWAYLNWALGFRAAGCDVVWLEEVASGLGGADVEWQVAQLKAGLETYGLADRVALWSAGREPLPPSAADTCLSLEDATRADLLLNQQYGMDRATLSRFRRTALLDIDPGLLQLWASAGHLSITPHDVYFTIGETVGQPGSRFPDLGIAWQYTPPCVALDAWTPVASEVGAPFSTVTHWHMGEWVGDGHAGYCNDKRAGFLPFLDLPRRTAQPLELALCLAPAENEERRMLKELGWRIRDSHAVTATLSDYQQYIQSSRGEFSCVKPSCVRLENAWISDRTLCYLASGKPAIVQHTGRSRFLPDAEGLFRFRTPAEAVSHLDAAANDSGRHSRLARALAEEHFGARKVARHLLERAL